MMIEQCHVIPDNFPVTNQMMVDVLPAGKTLKDEVNVCKDYTNICGIFKLTTL